MRHNAWGRIAIALLVGVLSFAAACGRTEEPSVLAAPPSSAVPACPTQDSLSRISEENRFRLACPQDFVLTTPKAGQIDAAEAKRRYAAFVETLTGTTEPRTVTARYYEDRSGEREDYWLLQSAATNAVDLAISADTGQLLGFRGTLRCDEMLPPSGQRLWDWTQEDHDHACATLTDAVETLSQRETLSDVFVNSISDEGNLCLIAEYADGRTADFHFRCTEDAVRLRAVVTTCEGTVDRWDVPWLADVRFVDPSNGSVQELWLNGRGVSELFP